MQAPSWFPTMAAPAQDMQVVMRGLPATAVIATSPTGTGKKGTFSMSQTQIAVIVGWRTDHPAAHRIATGTVAISALTALPAFFVAGVPVLLRVMAGSSILLAIVIAVLLLSPTQRSRVPQSA